jgi:hypothetical protein
MTKSLVFPVVSDYFAPDRLFVKAFSWPQMKLVLGEPVEYYDSTLGL